MNIIKAPGTTRSTSPSVFLAGTIEMGTARDWQQELSDALIPYPITIYNPRRNEWDASWNNHGDHISPQLRQQINWELRHLEDADLIAMWLEGNSKSPITLLELGIHSRHPKIVIGCPPEYYRAANVYVTADYYGLPLCRDWESFVQAVQNRVMQLCTKQ